jgi:hypothetical protein
MKKILFVLLAFSLVFVGCKKKGCTDPAALNYDSKAKQEDGSCEFPVPDGLNWVLFPNGNSENYPWPTWTANSNSVKNILIEDFTGHTCVGCPAASTEASNIESANPGRVIVASIHASTTSAFQEPGPSPFTADFRTDAGNEYATTFGCDLNPLGMTNRTLGTYPSTDPMLQLHTSWGTSTTALLATALDVNMQVQYNYYPSTNGLFVHTETDFINAKSGTYNMVIYLVRDTVISPQKLPGGIEEEDYYHHNVLSTNINGTWGEELFNGSAAAGDKFYNDYSFEVPSSDTTYDIDNLSIVTYVFNRDTYEILQVIKTAL